MPYKVVKSSGARPYKIVRRDTGKVVGTSKTRAMAEASIRARGMAKHNPGAMRSGQGRRG